MSQQKKDLWVNRLLCVFFLVCLPLEATFAEELIKKSNSGSCHDRPSPHYKRTKNPNLSIELGSCLEGGGGIQKEHLRFQSGISATAYQERRKIPQLTPQQITSFASQTSGYDRAHFGQWIDEDGDCLNTRHELLLKLSTSTIELGGNRCLVHRGRWNDPYTGQIFYESRQMDIDHLVPLQWAWEHGAYSWSHDKRVAFANDELNLFAVKASINRQKGALGPLHWLPPNEAFRCQYILRFMRVVKKYGLVYTSAELDAMDALRLSICRLHSSRRLADPLG